MIGLEPLLSALRESGLPVGVAEVARLREVFALEPRLAIEDQYARRLKAVLRAVLVKSGEDRAVFERVVEVWLNRAGSDLDLREAPVHERHPAQGQPASRPRLRRYFWRAVAVVVLSLLSFARGGPIKVIRDHPKRIIADPVLERTDPRAAVPQSTPLNLDDIRKRTFITWVPTITVTPAESVWQGWPPLALGILAITTAGGLWLALRKRPWFPEAAPEPVKKGPPRVFLTAPRLAGPQLLEAREEEALVWGIGHFVAEEPTRRLDLPATVRATARAAGLPQLRFQQARYPREVWLWVDEAADDPAIERITDEVEAALQAHSLPVERALFRGVPDWLVSTTGQSFAPNEVDERRDAALVAILTDGRSLARQLAADDRRVYLDALLRSLSHWPRLAFVDFASGPSELAALLPKHSLTRITPMELAAFLGGDEALQRRVAKATEGDAVWAAACALAPSSIDEPRALELRRRLRLAASPWALRALRIEAPGPPGRLQWQGSGRAGRINWLHTAEAQEKDDLADSSLLGRAHAFWSEIYDQELDPRRKGGSEVSVEGTPAHQHLLMERALLRLWRRQAAPAAVRELHSLHGGILREAIERHLGNLAPLDYGGEELVHLPWRWEVRSGPERAMLQEMKLGGGMPAVTLGRPGRLLLGIGLCLGLAAGALSVAALSGSRPLEGAPVVVHVPAKPSRAAAYSYSLDSPKGRRWWVIVKTHKSFTKQEVPWGALVTVQWAKKDLPCVAAKAGSEIWSCGSLTRPPRLDETEGPSAIGLATVPGTLGADALAVDLIDSGSADVVAIQRDWKSLGGSSGERLLVLPESPWSDLAESLHFAGNRAVSEVWPNLKLLAGDPRHLLRGLSDVAFVHVPAGTFMMGDAIGGPAHRVTLGEYWIGQYEITNAQFQGKGSDDRPATEVSWFDAKAFCEQHGWRLPTEAEWEYAARAGSQTAWSFGNDEKALGDYAWFDENSGGQIHSVGTRKPNPWGIYDMHGNAWEWIADWYGLYKPDAQRDPSGPSTGDSRVLRGGAFDFPPGFLRSALRLRIEPSIRYRDVGFRCARGPSPPTPLPPPSRPAGRGAPPPK